MKLLILLKIYNTIFLGFDKNAELLIKNGADVNLANKNGATPLDISAFNGKYSIFHNLKTQHHTMTYFKCEKDK